jgi:Ni/Fe-hydrogenase subunit HybB-like protein
MELVLLNILSNSCYSWGVKVALFDKALILGLACGALAMCAMWVGNCFKKCAVGKK